jgi:hypothetical protein
LKLKEPSSELGIGHQCCQTVASRYVLASFRRVITLGKQNRPRMLSIVSSLCSFDIVHYDISFATELCRDTGNPGEISDRADISGDTSRYLVRVGDKKCWWRSKCHSIEGGVAAFFSTSYLTTTSSSNNRPSTPRIPQNLRPEYPQVTDCQVSHPAAGGNVVTTSTEQRSKAGPVSPATMHPPARQPASTIEPIYVSSTDSSSPVSSTATLTSASITFNVSKFVQDVSPLRDRDTLVKNAQSTGSRAHRLREGVSSANSGSQSTARVPAPSSHLKLGLETPSTKYSARD